MRGHLLFVVVHAIALSAASIGCAPDERDDTSAAASDISAGASGSGINDLMSLSSGDTHSNQTPMGVHYEDAAQHVVTASEQAFFDDATQLPPVPPSVSYLHFESFSVTLYPSGSPTPADVNQHAVGDCSAAAVMASLAMLSPTFIMKIIDDYGDGTYGVHVYDPSGNPFVINLDSRFLASSPTDLEGISGKSGGADWATVFEKAAMKYLAVFPITSKIGGIGSEYMSPMLTGSGDSFAFNPGALNASQLNRAVRASLAHGKIVIGGFNKVKPLGSVQTVTGHAYTILVPGSNAMISMRNPWGASPFVSGGYDNGHDGVIDVPSASQWSNTIDLRIIDPGAASGLGMTTPYEP